VPKGSWHALSHDRQAHTELRANCADRKLQLLLLRLWEGHKGAYLNSPVSAIPCWQQEQQQQQQQSHH
jgi:hypothetical protein